jgi:hypothetical protein
VPGDAPPDWWAWLTGDAPPALDLDALRALAEGLPDE